MSAAPVINYSVEDLTKLLDQKWQGQVELYDIDASTVLMSSPNKAVIGVSNSSDPTRLLNLAIDKGLSQICQFSNLQIEREMNTSASMLISPKEFIKYPVSTILNPLHASQKEEKKLITWNIQFSKASEKSQTLHQLDEFLRQHIKAETLISDIKVIADELFTNAIYNAPYINTREGSQVLIDRTDLSAQMHPGDFGHIFAAVKDNNLVIGCKDPYGSLLLTKLLKRILKCYRNGVASMMKMGTGGAGIGSYMVYNSSASYYVGVQKNQATVVCCSLPINMSSRRRESIAKNMHFFEIDGGQK
ncbi:MAG: hypothetical protein KDD34_02350 [Bdellovibrionales bacterium]|nr:hypothetical protein [Bdellovibrionales bacterium]